MNGRIRTFFLTSAPSTEGRVASHRRTAPCVATTMPSRVTTTAVELDLLSDPDDAEALDIGVERLLTIVDAGAWEGVGAPLVPDDARDAARRGDWVRSNLGAYVHVSGSCRMGRRDDPLAVVARRCLSNEGRGSGHRVTFLRRPRPGSCRSVRATARGRFCARHCRRNPRRR